MAIYIKNTPNSSDSLPTILYENLFTLGTLIASSEATNYPKENAVSETTTEYWKPTALPAQLVVNLPTSTMADSFAIVGHNLGSKNCQFGLWGSNDGVTYTPVYNGISPEDDSPILMLFGGVSYPFWRLQIGSGDSLPYISVVMLGRRFNFPAGVKPPYTPVWLSQSYDLLTATSVGGQFMGNRVLRGGGKTSIDLVSLETGFVENSLLEFRDHYNLGKPFIWSSSPYYFPKDVGYVWRTESSTMSPTFDSTGNWMSTSMEVYAYGN